MSDPVTNVEIEDVLSSIRRLVSDGERAKSRDEQTETSDLSTDPPADPASEGNVTNTEDTVRDRLVLTPAFMVPDVSVEHEGEDDAETSKSAGLNDHIVPDEGHTVDDIEDDDVWVEEAWKSSGNDVAPGPHDEPSIPEADIDDDVWATDEAPLTDTDLADAWDEEPESAEQNDAPHNLTDFVWEPAKDEPAHEAQPDRPRLDLASTIAELEAAVSSGTEEFEPDGSEVTQAAAAAIPWPGRTGRAGGADDLVEDSTESSFKSPDETSPEETKLQESAAETEATPSILNESVSETADHITPTFVHKHHADRPSLAVTQDGDVHDTRAVENDVDASALREIDLDDDVLRELVAEVVKQELTGPLGERITRNVRKLVRREIYRILSSQDFD